MGPEPRWVLAGRWIIDHLPESLIARIDAWANAPEKPPKPKCEWMSYYKRQCIHNAGHGGTCTTIGPENKWRSWYGINYDMIEGLPYPKRQEMVRTGSMRLGH